MNTLSDTEEGRARPSVWPVYLAAVTITVAGLMYLLPQLVILTLIPTVVEQSEYRAWIYIMFLAATGFGLFGVVTGIGMLRLRPWGWLCGVVFAGVWAALHGMALLGMLIASLEGQESAPAAGSVVLTALPLVVAVLLIVVLATRRRLFFPRA